MAAPSPTPYQTSVTRLDEQFKFGVGTLIYDSLNKLVTAIEGRLQPLDQKTVDLDAIINDIMGVALERMDETFTPLINEATARLTQFGAAFSASSTTTLTIGTGARSLIIPVGQREGFVFGDFVAIRHTGGNESMTAQVVSYQRDIGQLNTTVFTVVGSGTFSDWGIFFSAAPNLAHETRFDNPHNVTAEQTGAYTTGEVDEILTQRSQQFTDMFNNLQQQITALQTASDLTVLSGRVATLETNMPVEDRKNRWIG